KIPGAMAEKWDDNTWSAWDGERTVWFSCWSLSKKDGTPVPAADVLRAMDLPEGKLIGHRDKHLVGKAIGQVTEEDGKKLINLMAYSAVDGKAALCNIFFPDKKDSDWAIETWHSMTAAPAKPSDESPM